MSKISKITALGSLSVAALMASQGAFAHTRLETNTVTEGTRVHNNIVLSHGCPGVEKADGTVLTRKPTFGTSVVFPNAITYTPVIGIDTTGTGYKAATTSTRPASDFYAPLAGIGQLIRTGGPFPIAEWKVDKLGNADGFHAYGKNYDQSISTPVMVDFRSAAVTINPTSCAKSVIFVPAIADFCNNINTPGSVATDHEIMYWSPIPNFADTNPPYSETNPYSLYDGYADQAHTIKGHGWNSPATLKVTRVSALPTADSDGKPCGSGYDVYVFPSADQINAELPIKKTAWQKAK